MCGIAGATGISGSSRLERFQEALKHRGPDESGQFYDGRVGLSHTRLAIIDLAAGSQPIFNEDRTCAIVFNGEIYNYRELRAELQPRHLFTTQTDTEVILHLYEERGLDTPSYLKGDFAFCIWDARDESCFLSRDPLGVKPLYYSISQSGQLVFSSELRAILQYPGVDDGIDAAALAEYLTCLYVAAPRTLMQGVRKLGPGESLVWKRNSVRTWTYWQIPDVQDHDVPAPEIRRRSLDLIKTSIRRRLIADVPVGAFLSGGLDSSLIVALASEYSPGLHTFSIGFPEKDFNELHYAKIVSERYRTNHHEFVIEPRAEKLIEDVIGAFDEPIADSSAIPTYLIARETRHYVKVALSGIGGDEMFFGYPRHLGAKVSESVPGLLRRPLAAVSSLWTSRPKGRDIGGWIRRFGNGLVLPPAARYVMWTTFLDPSTRAQLLHESADSGADPEPNLLSALGPMNGGFLDRIFRFDVSRYLAFDLLPLCDNMTMAHSVEARVPFCDVDLVSEMARLPASARMPGYRLKSVLRDIARNYLPPEILNRRKQGFMIPIGRWFRHELRDYVESRLDASSLPEMIDAKAVHSLWSAHLRERVNATHVLWAIVLFSAWFRKAREKRALYV